MALNPSTNPTMSSRVTAADANYPYASAKDETSPGAGDGTPYFKARADDLFGLQQALLRAASITPSGNADTALVSEYLRGFVEIASGRAFNYDDSGAVDAYVLDVQSNQQAPQTLFDGLLFRFDPANACTGGAVTLNQAGLGIKSLKTEAGADPALGDIIPGIWVEGHYDTSLGYHVITRSAAGTSIGTGNISGLTAINGGVDSDHDIDISVGIARAADDSTNIELLTAITKQIDATWVAGDDAGGLFSGTVANTTWYHVFVIKKDSDGTVDAGFDTSTVAANIPTGYTAYRRIGSVLTDGSANILGFRVNSGMIWFKAPTQDVNTSIGTTPTSFVIKTPLGLRVPAILAFAGDQGVSGNLYAWVYSPDDSDPSTPSTTNHNYGTAGDTGVTTNQMLVQTNSSSQIRVVYSTAARPLYITTLGWIDDRSV